MRFAGLSVTPVLQALVLEQLPEHRATGNGLFMLLAFFIRSINALLIGVIGDTAGLKVAFLIIAIMTLAAVPLVWRLPELDAQRSQ